MNATEHTTSTDRLDAEPPGEQRTLPEFAGAADANRCRAIATTTSRRCRHEALPGVEYCGQHYQMGHAESDG